MRLELGGRLKLTPGIVTLGVIALVGLGLIINRFFYGLGAVTHLSDGYPWGFWIGMDILVGIALAAGGFVMAGMVHLFGGERFHHLARPAILTALLGYLLFIGALMVDLGRPWHIWKALVSWNHASPMFEVAWCVMFYTFVLLLEFVPVALEGLKLDRLLQLWRKAVPFLVVAMLTLFTFAMTGSPVWTATTFTVFTGWEIATRYGLASRETQIPILLIISGVVLSTLHQSSLGTLFLIVDKLHPLWYTPVLPLLFFASAVMAAPAVVMFESTVAGKALGHREHSDMLTDLAGGMPYLVGLYLVFRLVDLVARQAVLASVAVSSQAGWFWLEIGFLVAALVMFATPELAADRKWRFRAAVLTMLSVVVHRFGVSMVGVSVAEYPRYVPAWSEVMITAGIFAAGVLAFRVIVAFLPVYEEELLPEAAAAQARQWITVTVAAKPRW